MQVQTILEELLVLMEQSGISIRKEAMGSTGGGLCILKDKHIFYVDTDAPSSETAILCAKALCECVDIENIYLRPQVRDFIEKYRDE